MPATTSNSTSRRRCVIARPMLAMLLAALTGAGAPALVLELVEVSKVEIELTLWLDNRSDRVVDVHGIRGTGPVAMMTSRPKLRDSGHVEVPWPDLRSVMSSLPAMEPPAPPRPPVLPGERRLLVGGRWLFEKHGQEVALLDQWGQAKLPKGEYRLSFATTAAPHDRAAWKRELVIALRAKGATEEAAKLDAEREAARYEKHWRALRQAYAGPLTSAELTVVIDPSATPFIR